MMQYRNIYMLGIGGIGMSALARYYCSRGVRVAGYDRQISNLTNKLGQEGIEVSTDEDVTAIPEWVKPENTLIIYTPALREDHPQLMHFREKNFKIIKRSLALADIVNEQELIAVAGTHGKTTTSAMIAHLLHDSGYGCNAFLGGISVNFDSNTLIDDDSDTVVVEADEYDRSFLNLTPTVAVITSVDADHLDIYGSGDSLTDGFRAFAGQLKESGRLIVRKGIDKALNVRALTYAIGQEGDLRAENVRVQDGAFVFDVRGIVNMDQCELPMPGRHNVENMLAAIGVAHELRIDADRIRRSVASFKGVRRRFEYQIRRDDLVYIDDYAHHPAELKACIGAVKEIFPGRKVTGIFQPHLFSRTRDFADEFAESLSELNELILLEIYPAREEPIPGVDSRMLLEKVKVDKKSLVRKEDLIAFLKERELEVLLTLGAGDIDRIVEPIKEALTVE